MESIMTMIILGVAMYMSLTFFDRLSLASKNEDIRLKTLAVNTAVIEEIKSNFYNGTIYDEVKVVDKDNNRIPDLDEAIDNGLTEEEFLIEFIKDKYTKHITPENSEVGPYYSTDVTVEKINLGIDRGLTEAKEKEAFLINIQKHDGTGYIDINKSEYIKYSGRFSSEIKRDESDENILDIKLYDRVCEFTNADGECADVSSAYRTNSSFGIVDGNLIDVNSDGDGQNGDNIPVVNGYYQVKLNTLLVPDIEGKNLTVDYYVDILDNTDVVKLLLRYTYKNDLISENNNSSIYKIKVKTAYGYGYDETAGEYVFTETKDSTMTMFVTPNGTEMD